MQESTESLSFLRVFLEFKSCHLETLLCGHFFTKLTPPLRSEGRKTLDWRFLSPTEPPRAVKRLAGVLAGPPPAATGSQRLKTTSQQPPQLPRVTSSQSLTAKCQPDTSPLACPVIDKSATTSLPRVTLCHVITQSPKISRIYKFDPKLFRNCSFAPKFSEIAKLPLNFHKLQFCPSTFENCRITPVFFEIAKVPLFFLKLQFCPY